MAHTCRGTLNLAGAYIDTIDPTTFVVTNGPSKVFFLRALSEVERQRWVTALELAKQKAIGVESGETARLWCPTHLPAAPPLSLSIQLSMIKLLMVTLYGVVLIPIIDSGIIVFKHACFCIKLL